MLSSTRSAALSGCALMSHGLPASPCQPDDPGLGMAAPMWRCLPPMDASQFEATADATLARLMEAVERAAGDAVDAELVGGILTLELEEGGIYQLNKHAANREIWLSSPVSGAWHFAWSDGDRAWRSTRGGDRLEDLLARDLSESLGEVIALD